MNYLSLQKPLSLSLSLKKYNLQRKVNIIQTLLDARLHWLVRKSGGKKKEEKEKAQPSSIPPKMGARVVRGKKDGIQRRGGVHSIRIRPCDVPRHLAAKKEKGKKGKRHTSHLSGVESSAWGGNGVFTGRREGSSLVRRRRG